MRLRNLAAGLAVGTLLRCCWLAAAMVLLPTPHEATSSYGRITAATSLFGPLFARTGRADDAAQSPNRTQVAQRSSSPMTISEAPFGKTSDGAGVTLYTLDNGRGMRVQLTNYGAIVVKVEVPDRDGQSANVNLGFDNLEGYLQRHPYFGSTVGRYCNRIAQGRFVLDGKEYKLAQNNGVNHLHGGKVGFDKAIWEAKKTTSSTAIGIQFTYRSPDGEEGYPGNLDVTASYSLTRDNELAVEFTATSDKATPLNLTNHCYWNLSGAGPNAKKILDHELQIKAERYLPVDETLIPTGELAPVAGTPLDFREPQKIGGRLAELGGDPPGYDHCYELPARKGELVLAARVRDPQSGRVMEVLTTQPGVQFYTGNFLSGSAADGGHGQHTGFCLETQHYPDSPNQPQFPNTILRPGEKFHQRTVHRFSAE